MALPSGVLYKTITISPIGDRGIRASLEVVVECSVNPLVWAATSEPIDSTFKTIRSTPNQSVIFQVPTVDQPGFVDKDLIPQRDWYYTVIVRYLFDGRKVGATVRKYLRPTSTDPGVIDFDDIPTGELPLYRGPAGERGKSAYELAVEHGYVGTEAEYIADLQSAIDNYELSAEARASAVTARDEAIAARDATILRTGEAVEARDRAEIAATAAEADRAETAAHASSAAESADVASESAAAVLEYYGQLPETTEGGFYEHIQGTPAAVWEIIHPLPFRPNVTVTDSAGTVVQTQIEYIDSTTIRSISAGPFSGFAHLS